MEDKKLGAISTEAISTEETSEEGRVESSDNDMVQRLSARFGKLLRKIFKPSPEDIEQKSHSLGFCLMYPGRDTKYLERLDGESRLKVYEALERLSARMQDPAWAEALRNNVLHKASVLEDLRHRNAVCRGGGKMPIVRWSTGSTRKIFLDDVPDKVTEEQPCLDKLKNIRDTDIDPVVWVRNILCHSAQIEIISPGELGISVDLGATEKDPQNSTDVLRYRLSWVI